MDLDSRTARWALSVLPPGTEIHTVGALGGGWSSLIRTLHTSRGDYVLRSMTRPELADRAAEMLTRETRALRMLESTGIPAPRVLGTDPSAACCAWPSLLMTRLPGRVVIAADSSAADSSAADSSAGDSSAGAWASAPARRRASALARQLAEIHRFRPPTPFPEYVAWSWPGEITHPVNTTRPDLWRLAEALITRTPPPYHPLFLHRDFHPGNVLFDDSGAITGVIDWTETSRGPADLDVAHCATMLALLHGDPLADFFVEAYRESGGRLAPDRPSHLYWRLLDALSFAPSAANAAGPWRALGRTDLTDAVLTTALERHLTHLLTTLA
ncbi:aminoglycoside phosphotransferase family protein [Actinoplanes sp. NPDC051851]|uniref:phosphotransferase family protein n=1 Tax=Actinoplanes sp. NPDC051851 TaxID=3154753 RepID=UPI003449E05C